MEESRGALQSECATWFLLLSSDFGNKIQPMRSIDLNDIYIYIYLLSCLLFLLLKAADGCFWTQNSMKYRVLCTLKLNAEKGQRKNCILNSMNIRCVSCVYFRVLAIVYMFSASSWSSNPRKTTHTMLNATLPSLDISFEYLCPRKDIIFKFY